MHEKQTIVWLQKHKFIRAIAGALGAAQSSVCYILRKQDRTGELSNIKGLDIHGGQQ